MWAQEGLSWFVGLTNLGGGFVLAAVVLMLHRDSLKAFREELAAERKANMDNVKSLIDMKIRNHEEILTRFASVEAQIASSYAATTERIRGLIEHRSGTTRKEDKV